MPNAYFEKDNEVVDGTKGNFVFRDFDAGFEYVSIMFEMKNESDTTNVRHKAEELTIRKLTFQNPTMKAKFEEAQDATFS